MFEELGYKKIEKGYYSKNMLEIFENNADTRICFWSDKTIEVYNFYDGSRCFDLQELQAINLKVKELDWI